MNIEVRSLPPGWRHPVGKSHARAAFGQIAEGFARLEMPSAESADVVAEATVTRPTPDFPWRAVVHVYGQREESYSDRAAAEFQDVVLPQIAGFLQEEMSQRQAVVPEPRDLTVRLDATGHRVTIARRHRETYE